MADASPGGVFVSGSSLNLSGLGVLGKIAKQIQFSTYGKDWQVGIGGSVVTLDR